MAGLISMVKDYIRYWVEPTARPVQIIRFPDNITEGGAPEFLFDQVDAILAKGGAEKLPVFVISITGVYRSGKSFLLNLMKTYLEYIAENKLSDDGWKEKTDVKISGGAWAKSKNAVTHGIWMWDHPFIIDGVAILLIDCQGTGDAKNNDKKLDILIQYIGLQMAHVQLFNISSRLLTTHLESLHLCSDYASAVDGIGMEDSAAIFDSLIFLIRDWSSDDYLGEKPGEIDEIISEAKSCEVRNFGEGIKRAFHYVTTFALPHPGSKVLKCSEEDKKLTIGQVDEEFLEYAKKLFKKMFVELPKATRETLRSGRSVAKRFKGLKERLVDGDLANLKIQTGAEALEESLLNKAFTDASVYYDREMSKALEMVYDSPEDIQVHIIEIAKKTISRFTDHRLIAKYGDSASRRQYKALLLSKRDPKIIGEKVSYIQSVQSALKERQNFAARSERLQRERREFEGVPEPLEQCPGSPSQQRQQKKLNKEKGFQNLVKKSEDEQEVKLRNKKLERADELRQSLERRALELLEEEKKLKEKEEVIAQGANELRTQVEEPILSEEETWVEAPLRQQSTCLVM